MEYAEEDTRKAAEKAAAETDKAAAAELGHYLLSLGSSSLGSTHEEYFQKYQEHFDKYIKVQNKIASDDDYGKLKILDAVNTDKDKGYFKFAAPNFKIHWIRRGSPKLKGIALEFTDKVISYGSSEDEILSSIIKRAVKHLALAMGI